MTTPSTPLEIRRASENDIPSILELGRRSLGWSGSAFDSELFLWKHRDNPFGASPMWVATCGPRTVGFRTFLRWELMRPDGTVCRAVRAVDTATDPEYQGRGIFRMLTSHALEDLLAEGVDFVFNTPNEQSRPGYLKMGWVQVGRLPIGIRPTRWSSLHALAGARRPADRGALPTDTGMTPGEAFSDVNALEALLGRVRHERGVATRRTVAYLRWRYGLAALHYRVITPSRGMAEGFVAYHLRRRGNAVELVIADEIARSPDAHRELTARLIRENEADYLIRLGSGTRRSGMVPLPRLGPVLTARALRGSPPRQIADWGFSLGDVELF